MTSEIDVTVHERGYFDPSERRTQLIILFACILLLTIVAHLVGENADAFGIRLGPAYKPAEPALFGHDSIYYRDIARNGYWFNGDLFSSPNIVFFPLFPLLTRGLAKLTMFSYTFAGFTVVFAAFAGGAMLLYNTICEEYGTGPAIAVSLGLCLGPGSFSLYAYYSESVMILCLGLCLHYYRKQADLPLAASAFLLGLARSAAGPICLVIGLTFLYRAWKAWSTERNLREATVHCIYFVTCGAGTALFLLYLWWQFGNPFILIPKIQMSSWQYYHQPMSFIDFITFKQFFVHVTKALRYGIFALDDPGPTNLFCLVVGMAAAVFCPFYFKKNPIIRWGFPLYFLLIYYSSIGGKQMGSVPRFLMPMIPVYFGAYEICRYVGKRTRPIVGVVLGVGILAFSIFLLGNYLLRFVLGWHDFF